MCAAHRAEPLLGSEPVHPESAESRGRTHDDEPVEVVFVLRPEPLASHHPLAPKLERLAAGREEPLTDAEFEEVRAPQEAHVARVVAFAEEQGLEVVEVSRARHQVVVRGSAHTVGRAFGVELCHYAHPRGDYRSHVGAVHLPPEVQEAIAGVLGLDQSSKRGDASSRPTLPGSNLSPLEFAARYEFPDEAPGKGQRIAVIAIHGGYHDSDMETYFSRILGLPRPEIFPYHVASASNQPMPMRNLDAMMEDFNDPSTTLDDMFQKWGPQVLNVQSTFEVTLDVQLAGALAPGAAIDVIFAPDSARGVSDAVHAAMGLTSAYPHTATVISYSWGLTEPGWTANDLKSIDAVLQGLKDRHLTMCCASGNFGSLTEPLSRAGDPPVARVQFPASSPWVLACGGTQSAPAECSGAPREETWNCPAAEASIGWHQASGGGVSGFFDRPTHQARAGVPAHADLDPRPWLSPGHEGKESFVGRGLPDVAANANLNEGYRIFVGNQESTGWGTSSATPLWAALIARLSEALGRPVGWLNERLYSPELAASLNDIVDCGNDTSGGKAVSFEARAGWDPCTGLGSPSGARLLEALRSSADPSAAD